jgi:hypothetical protein
MQNPPIIFSLRGNYDLPLHQSTLNIISDLLMEGKVIVTFWGEINGGGFEIYIKMQNPTTNFSPQGNYNLPLHQSTLNTLADFFMERQRSIPFGGKINRGFFHFINKIKIYSMILQ